MHSLESLESVELLITHIFFLTDVANPDLVITTHLDSRSRSTILNGRFTSESFYFTSMKQRPHISGSGLSRHKFPNVEIKQIKNFTRLLTKLIFISTISILVTAYRKLQVHYPQWHPCAHLPMAPPQNLQKKKKTSSTLRPTQTPTNSQTTTLENGDVHVATPRKAPR